MGTVIRFPDVARAARKRGSRGKRGQSATVIILPAIRIERYADEPSGRDANGHHRRRRRRRAARS
jgi:hypothetical protein